MRAVMVVGVVVAAVVLAPEAGAAASQATGNCRSGTFSGSFSLSYESDGTNRRPTELRGGAGPYIGDSGTLKIRLSHIDATSSEHVVYLKERTGVPAGRRYYDIPDGILLPSEDKSLVAVSFSGGGSSCTARSEIK